MWSMALALALAETGDNTLSDNVATQNGTGFAMSDTSGNTLTGNIANQNTLRGFDLFPGSTGNTLSKNRSMANALGFRAQEGSVGNTFTRNVAQANSDWDAEDDNGPGANTWLNNQFGSTTRPLDLSKALRGRPLPPSQSLRLKVACRRSRCGAAAALFGYGLDGPAWTRTRDRRIMSWRLRSRSVSAHLRKRRQSAGIVAITDLIISCHLGRSRYHPVATLHGLQPSRRLRARSVDSRCAQLQDLAAGRSSLRHCHLPLHGRRGLDEAAARARRRGLRGGSCRAPARDPRGLRRRRRSRGGHPGRRVLLRLPDGAGSGCGRRGDDRGAGVRADPRTDRPAHGHAAPYRGGIRRRRRPPGRPPRGRRATAARCSSPRPPPSSSRSSSRTSASTA